MSLAQFIDHTILKPTTTRADVNKICDEAKEYQFAAVCVPPVYVKEAMGFLKSSGVKVATVIGFPFGYNHIEIKLEEVKKAKEDGTDEVDMVMNLAALKNGDMDYLKSEIAAISTFTKAHALTLKVIIESGILTEEEIINCCNIYKNYPVQYLKTSTGYAEKGATVEAVKIMRAHLPPAIQIKASGGIKTFAFAKQLVAAGATRLGCSASVAIVTDVAAQTDGY